MFIIYRIERSKVSQDVISDKVNDITLFDFQRFDRRHSDLYQVLIYLSFFFKKKKDCQHHPSECARCGRKYCDTDN